ncbi:MAG: A/G-specific adenine glycosylase [Bdellovibrionales bacterium]|nr:A/G-specific adenine glycosylase [Bdellovibrionales bacterium]
MSVKIVKNLSAWFQKSARDLPWRKNPHPYWIWLSEIMLQQTRVATMLPYFEKFTLEFPDVGELAKAPEERVLKLWAGLGYYSRARNLHRGARKIHERLEAGLGFPKTAEEWSAIPGVGPYTAGAVASIAYGQRAPIVDGNVVRVLSRVYAIQKLDSAKSLIWHHSRRLVELKDANPRILNQALMELGAILCLPKNPKCGECPIRGSCKGKGRPASFPEKKPGKSWRHLQEKRWIPLRSRGPFREIFLVQNKKGAWREGLWDFPVPDSSAVTSGALLFEFKVRYVVTNHKVERTHCVFLVKNRGSMGLRGGRWFLLEDLPGVPAPVRKAIIELERGRSRAPDREAFAKAESGPEA